MADKLERAYIWLNWGADLLPVQPNSKHMVGRFGPHQTRITSEVEAFKWFEERRCNLALVLDHNFVAADFDDEKTYLAWAAEHGAEVQTYAERTARGAHVIWRGDGLPAGHAPGLEFKTSGALLIAPSVHPSGVVYQIVCDLPPAHLTLEKAKSLFPFLTVQAPGSAPAVAAAPAAGPNQSKIEIIKSRVSIVDELSAAGVKSWKSSGSAFVALCPFHHDKNPSLWAMPGRGVWGCNAPSCLAFGKHDVINARALRRRLTVPEAIRELWAEVR